MYDYAKWGMYDYVQLKEKKCYQKKRQGLGEKARQT